MSDTRNSQFLYSYLDELLRGDWLTWSNKIISSQPAEENQVAKGFQNLAGSGGAGPRSRAGECFRLGLLTGRLISSRGGGSASFPRGWKDICEGKSIHTKLGYFAYAIGLGLKHDPENAKIKEALSALAATVLPLIGFQHDDRWYSTVYVFEFVRNRIEEIEQRPLTPDEVRILSGMVVNTLDSEKGPELVDAYKKNSQSFSLFLNLTESVGKYSTGLAEFPLDKVCEAASIINPNNIKKPKAALFWAADRGIYTLANNPNGACLIKALSDLERERIENSEDHLLNSFFHGIENEGESVDVVELLSKTLSGTQRSAWLKIMKTLKDGVLEGLQFVSEELSIEVSTRFYVHDDIDAPKDFSAIEIAKADCLVVPSEGSTVVFRGGEEFVISSVSDNADSYTLQMDNAE